MSKLKLGHRVTALGSHDLQLLENKVNRTLELIHKYEVVDIKYTCCAKGDLGELAYVAYIHWRIVWGHQEEDC